MTSQNAIKLTRSEIGLKIENKNEQNDLKLAYDRQKNFFLEERDKSFVRDKLKLQLKSCNLSFRNWPIFKLKLAFWDWPLQAGNWPQNPKSESFDLKWYRFGLKNRQNYFGFF